MKRKTVVWWRWSVPASHAGQTRLSWWVEQLAVNALTHVAIRAYKRGDLRTVERIRAIAMAGQQCEDRPLVPRGGVRFI